MPAEKRTEQVKINLTPTEALAVGRLANAEDRSLSDFCARVIRLYAFGHLRTLDDDGTGRRDE